jgi:hypothetical protein
MTFCENPLSRSLLGAKRTCPFALHMSASDPKRTWGYGSRSDLSKNILRAMHKKFHHVLVMLGPIRLA